MNLYKKILSGTVIFTLLFTQMLSAPIANAQFFFFNKNVVEESKQTGIIAVLVDEDVLENTTVYQGITSDYPDDLNSFTLQSRIQRFASDLQAAEPFTQSIIISVPKNATPHQISGSLENLYKNGYTGLRDTNRLKGVVLVGDLPLPVVNKNGNRFISMYPYTDFDEKVYPYDLSSQEFSYNADIRQPSPEVWHSVINSQNENTDLAYYFDKNHLFHIKNPDFASFNKKLLFADLNMESQKLNTSFLDRYKNYADNLESFAYKKFSKNFLTFLINNVEKHDGDGEDNDGDGLIDEDPINGFDDDGDGEDGSPLDGCADYVDNDHDGDTDEEDECLLGLYKIADGVDNDNDGLIDEGIDEDNGHEYLGIDNDRDGQIDEDSQADNDRDNDGVRDEDPEGDRNSDNCPGFCGVDDDGDGHIDDLPLITEITCKDADNNLHPEWDDDEDGKCDEDGLEDNDNDFDGQTDEDAFYDPTGFDFANIDSLGDIQSKIIIDKYAYRYNELFPSFYQDFNEYISSTGRYDIERDADDMVSVITNYDLYVQEYLKSINNETRDRVNALLEDLQKDVQVYKFVELGGSVKMDNNNIVALDNFTFNNNSIKSYNDPVINVARDTVYFHGEAAPEIASADMCTLYNGSLVDGQGQITEHSQVSNVETYEDDDPDFAGCFALNFYKPERCFPLLAEKNIYDDLGTRAANDTSEELLDYRGCNIFYEENKYSNYEIEVASYFAALALAPNEEAKDLVPLPDSPFIDSGDITLITLPGPYNYPITLRDILDLYGGYDGVDNDNDGDIDEEDEYNLQYKIDENDWPKISASLLANKNATFILSDPPFNGVKQITLSVSRINELIFHEPDANHAAVWSEPLGLNSMVIHEAPLIDTIKKQLQAGFSKSIPVDQEFYVSFKNQDNEYQKLIYPNAFDHTSGAFYKQKLEEVEEYLISLPGAVEDDIEEELIKIFNETDFDIKKVDKAIKWQSADLDEKHVIAVKSLIDQDEIAFVPKDDKGYEIAYITVEGDGSEMNFAFEQDDPPAEEDADWKDPMANVSEETIEDDVLGAGSDSGIESAIPLLVWFVYIIEYLGELSTTPAISFSPVCGDEFLSNCLDGTDGDKDGIPDDEDLAPNSQDGDGNGVPDGADLTTSLEIYLDSDLPIIDANQDRAVKLIVESRDAGESLNKKDSFSQIKLTLQQEDEIIELVSPDPTPLLGGKAVFQIKPNGISGNFKASAETINHPVNKKSNTLPLRSEAKKIKLTSYRTELTQPKTYTKETLQTYIVKNDAGNTIAEIDPITGKITIKDSAYDIEAFESTYDKQFRVGIVEIASGNNYGNIVFVPEKDLAIEKHNSDYSLEDNLLELSGVHIKDRVGSDGFIAVTRDSDKKSYHIVDVSDEYADRVAKITHDGNIYIADGFLIEIKNRNKTDEPYIFTLLSPSKEVIFEFYIAYPQNEVDLQDYNLSYIDEAVQRFADRFIRTAHAQTETLLQDSDQDGLNDLEELYLLTDRLNEDTDNDGFKDGEEIENGFDPTIADEALFNDLGSDHEAYDAFVTLLTRGIIEAKEARPDDFITREEFVQLVLGIGCVNCTAFSAQTIESVEDAYNVAPFPDTKNISNEKLYCVEEAKNQQIVSGYEGGEFEGLFVPQNNISRAEALKVILETGNAEIDRFSLEGRPWYYNYLLSAQKNSIFPKQSLESLYALNFYSPEDFKVWVDEQLTQTNSTISKYMTAPITRAEFAIMINNIISIFDCYLVDIDGDGVPDNIEVFELNTSPTNPDTDGGGLDDLSEMLEGKDPLDSSDDSLVEEDYLDIDKDGLTKLQEDTIGTDYTNPDTDGGGVIDGVEVAHLLDPLDPSDDDSLDSDGDGMPDSWEELHNLNPQNPEDAKVDFDSDGLTNLREYQVNTDPRDPDTDDGTIDDGDEVILQTTEPRDPADDNTKGDLESGVYVFGDNILEDVVFEEIELEGPEERPIFTNQVPADDVSTLFVEAQIIDENGDIVKTDNQSIIEFSAIYENEDGSTTATYEILQNKVKVKEGVATTEIKSTAKADISDVKARLVQGLLPADDYEIDTYALPATEIVITPDSSVLVAGGASKTNVVLTLNDENGNITNNDYYTLTLEIDGPGEIPIEFDEDRTTEGIQLETLEGFIEFDVISTEEVGDITLTAKLDEDAAVNGSGLIESRDDLTVEIKTDQNNLVADGQDSMIVKIQVVDNDGITVQGFNHQITTSLSNPSLVQLIPVTGDNLIDGDSLIELISTTKSGDLGLIVNIPGFNLDPFVISVRANDPLYIELKTDKDLISSDETINIDAELYDKYGNFVSHDNSAEIALEVTKATNNYGKIVGDDILTVIDGKATFSVKGTGASGIINLKATAQDLVSGTLTLTTKKFISARDMLGENPNVLYASVLGMPAGDIEEDEYIGGELLFKGRTQAVTTVTSATEGHMSVASVFPEGGIEINDTENGLAQVNPSSTPSDPLTINIADPLTLKPHAKVYYTFPDTFGAFIVDSITDIGSSGVYVRKIQDNLPYSYEDKGSYVSVLFNNEESVKVYDTGKVIVNDDAFSLNLSKDPNSFLVLSLSHFNNEIAEVYFMTNFTDKVEMVEETFEYQKGFSYQEGIKVKALKESAFEFENKFVSDTTANPKGAVLLDPGRQIPESQKPGFSFTSYDDALTKNGVGFDGDNKFMLLFSAGETVGNSTAMYASDNLINFGDPTVSIDNSIMASATGFTQDIGKQIFGSDSVIVQILQTDYDGDGLEDIVVGYENGKVRLFQNTHSTPRFIDKGFILDIPIKIYTMVSADFNNDQIDDLLVATQESCLKGEQCVYLYENQKGAYLRSHVPLDIKSRIYDMKSDDMNNDGYADIVTSEENGDLKVFYNWNGKIDTNGQLIENLGLHIDPEKDLKDEVLIYYNDMPEEDPDSFDDDFDYKVLPIKKEKGNLNNEFLSPEEISKLISLGASYDDVSAPSEKMFIYMDKDPKFGNGQSNKQAIDVNKETLMVGDTVEYTITLFNNSGQDINNLMLNDIVPDILDLDTESYECVNCKNPVQFLETGLSSRPIIVQGIDIPAHAERFISYKAVVNFTPKIQIDLNKSFGVGYQEDQYPDIFANPEHNTSGSHLFFYTVTRNQNNTMRYNKYTGSEDVGDPAEPQVDLETDNNHNDIPDALEDILDEYQSDDDDGDGLPNMWDDVDGALDDIADNLKDVTSKISCKGGCLPLPINFAFLAPGPINIMGIPGGFDIGLPVFGAATAPPFVYPPAPVPTTINRLYVSPTLTGNLGISLCIGPYMGAQCYTIPIPIMDLLLPGICEKINEAIGSAMSKASTFVSSPGGTTVISGGGSGGSGQNISPRQGSGGIAGSDALGNYNFSASVKTNAKVPGFLNVVTGWLASQYEEIITKLSDLPDIYVLYPDPSSFAKDLPDEIKVNNFNDIIALINSMPIIEVDMKPITMKIPALSAKEIQKYQFQLNQWLNGLKIQLSSFKVEWKCDSANPPFPEICSVGLPKINAMIDIGETTLSNLESYKTLPRDILEWRNLQTKYIYQIICYIDTMIQYTGGYLKKQLDILDQWRNLFTEIKKILETWMGILNLMTDYSQKCDKCKSERYSLMQMILQIVVPIPSPPVIPFPKWPDIYFDFSQIQLGAQIVLPDVKFQTEQIVLPNLPTLTLPTPSSLGIDVSVEVPKLPSSFNINAAFNFPQIPTLPELPDFPELPDLPGLPLPTLPDLPKPPKPPKMPGGVTVTVNVFKKILNILCILKLGAAPTNETSLKTHIESLTGRPLTANFPLDTIFKFQGFPMQIPFVDKIEIITKMDLNIKTEFVYDAASEIVKEWNSVQTDLGAQVQEGLDAIDEGLDEVQEGLDETKEVIDDANDQLALTKELESHIQTLSIYGKQNQEFMEALSVLPKEYTLTATQHMIMLDDERIQKPVATIRNTLENNPYNSSYLAQLNKGLLAYYDQTQLLNHQLNSSTNFDERFKLIANSKSIDDYLNVHTLTASTENFVPSVSASNEDDRYVAINPDAISSNVIDPNTASNPPQSQSIEGLFIFNEAEGTNEKLILFEGEAHLNSNLLFIDYDKDDDDDIVYAYGGNIYLKENHTNTPSGKFAQYITSKPQTYQLNEFTPFYDSITGFAVTYTPVETTFTWDVVDNPSISGYEITYKTNRRAFEDPSVASAHKINVVEETAHEELSYEGDVYVSNKNGEATLNTYPRTLMNIITPELTLNPKTIIHSLEDSVIILKEESSSGEVERETIELPANTVYSLPSYIITEKSINVSNGVIELIHTENPRVKNIPVQQGMLIMFDDEIYMNGGTIAISYADGSETNISDNGSFILKRLFSPENPTVTFEPEHGNYFAQITSFDSEGVRSLGSDIVLFSPQICGDKESPFVSAGKENQRTPIFRTHEIDATQSFDIFGNITKFYIDIDPTNDTDGDGDTENDADIINSDPSNPIFNLGPYNELRTYNIVVIAEDQAKNQGKQHIAIEVFVPEITLDESSGFTDVVSGEIDPEFDNMPITIIRERNGMFKELISDSADEIGKYYTDENGDFEILDYNYDDLILIRNSNGDIVATVDPETGRVIITLEGYYVDVLEALPPNLPTRIIIVEEESTSIMGTILLVPDVNTDVTIDDPTFEYTIESVLGMRGVHVRDTNTNDNITIDKLPASDPNFPGGVKFDLEEERISLLTTGGDIYFFEPGLDLRLKEALVPEEPIIIEVLYQNSIAAEFYTAVNSDELVQIVDRGEIGLASEVVNDSDQDGDGMPDWFEFKYGFDALDPNDGNRDADGDGLSNLEEYRLGSNPLNEDSDGDGFLDGEEVRFGKDPNSYAEVPFTDVNSDNPYYQSILNLAQRNILQGEEVDGLLYFYPKNDLMRKEYTDIILKMLCIIPRPEAYKEPTFFYDVNYSEPLDYYYAVIKEAVWQGFITGYIGEIDPVTDLPPFKPDNTIIKAEAVKIILEALELQGIITLADIDIEGAEIWYEPYMVVAQDLGPILEKPAEVNEPFIVTPQEALSPEDEVSKEEFVAMADRVLQAFDCYEIDTDGDGMPDVWENENGLDPFDPDDANRDPDGEGLLTIDEYRYGTNPYDPDTDDGGATDKEEVDRGTNPINFPQDDPLFDQDDGDQLDRRDIKSTLDEGIYLVKEACNSCPCISAIDHSADLIPGDKIFGIISNDNNTTVYSKSNIIRFEGLPEE